MNKLRIVFLGTPEFAVPTLEALASHGDMEVVAVVSQPDRPAGRNHKMQETATKQAAIRHSIPVLQPEKLSKSDEAVQTLSALAPDLIVTVAFGQILKKNVLSLPRLGVINLHGSLLPSYRGPAPINWAIINGDTATGLTTMYTEAGVDTGPMLLKQSFPIGPDTDASELSNLLSNAGPNLVIQTLEKLMAGTLVPEIQDNNRATYAPMLTKELGRIDWYKSASSVHNLVRGLVPWPGTFTHFRGEPIKIWKTSTELASCELKEIALDNLVPGIIAVSNKTVLVKCGATSANEFIQLVTVQPANRAKLKALDWLNGVRIEPGERLIN